MKPVNDESNPAQDYTAGAAALGGAAIAAPYAKRALTGRTTLFHGTRPDLHPEILREGLKPAAVKQKGITEILGDAVPEAKSLVYTTPKKQDARQYFVQADHLKHLFDQNPNPSQGEVMEHIGALRSNPKQLARILNPLDNAGILEANVPLWKKEYAGKLTPNPEAGKNLDDYIGRKGILGALQPKAIHKLERDSLMQAHVFKDGLGPEVFKKSPHYKGLSLGEIGEYARTKPGRFALGVAGTAGALGLAGYGAHRLYQGYQKAHGESLPDADAKTDVKTAAVLDELAKLGAVSDDQARAALDRYETLERNKPTLNQVGRYGALGAAAGVGVGALGNAIKGGRLPGVGVLGHLAGAKAPGVGNALRAAGAAAATGAIGMGAIPLVRNHLDRRAEVGTLQKYLAERGVDTAHRGAPTAGKLSEPFEPVEKAAAKVPKKEKDSGMTGVTPARGFDASAYDVGLLKGASPVGWAFNALRAVQGVKDIKKHLSKKKHAFATSQYAANLGSPFVPQKSHQPGFRAPSLQSVGQADPQQIKTGGSMPTRGGFLMASDLPAFRPSTLKSPIQTTPQQIATKLGSIPTTPTGRLSKAMSVGAPKVTAPPGPSIQQIAKPHGFGKPLPGATKTVG